MTENQLNLAAWISHTEAEGPGKRYALWVQGCPLRCQGCCNPHMLADQPKQIKTVQQVYQDILMAKQHYAIEGVTFLGGEPFYQAAALAQLAKKIKPLDLSVMVFSGYTLKQLTQQQRSDWQQLLDCIDLLVDGPYLAKYQSKQRRWIGSSNQQLTIFNTDYQHYQQHFMGKNTIELRLSANQLTINGFPNQQLTDLINQAISHD